MAHNCRQHRRLDAGRRIDACEHPRQRCYPPPCAQQLVTAPTRSGAREPLRRSPSPALRRAKRRPRFRLSTGRTRWLAGAHTAVSPGTDRRRETMARTIAVTVRDGKVLAGNPRNSALYPDLICQLDHSGIAQAATCSSLAMCKRWLERSKTPPGQTHSPAAWATLSPA
jgi:hypothetical protein